MNSLFLDALACHPTPRPPVWMMRQAGRYLPDYQTLRRSRSLSELFHHPGLAAEITLMPVQQLGVDAAILFSDILVIAELFGLQIEFPEKGGPRIVPQLDATALAALPHKAACEHLPYVAETIGLLKPQLCVPLIGFCGGPYTVATYLLGKQTTFNSSFETLLQHLTSASIDYLNLQIDAGVDAIQIFDSWAGSLPLAEFERFSCRYLQPIIAHVKSRNIPILIFCRGSGRFARQLIDLEPTAISFDEELPLAHLRQATPSHIAVQGNLSPTLLRDGSPHEVVAATSHLLETMEGKAGFIANLGHGVLPETPLENVRAFVDTVKAKKIELLHNKALPAYHLTSGGMEQRMASGLPPERKPKRVPRS